MNVVLRCGVVALLIVLGIMFLAVCDEVACVACSHISCGGADSPSTLGRVAQVLRRVCAPFAVSLTAPLAIASRRPADATPLISLPLLLTASSLRI